MKKFTVCLLICLIMLGTGVCVFSAENKSIEAPTINYTLSETADTWNPITITLDITDDEEIVSVRYVKVSNYYHGVDESEIDFVSVPHTIDCYEFFVNDYYVNGDAEYEKLFGSRERGYIAANYYANAISDYDPAEDISIPVEENKFTVYFNYKYIVCAEDKTGNKTFKEIRISNIKTASADVDLSLCADLSGEYLAEARLDITENPNAPVTNAYVYNTAKEPVYGGPIDYAERVEDAKESGTLIQPVDGIYYFKDFGEYRVVVEDEWGGFYASIFEVSSAAAAPEVKYEYRMLDDNSAVVYINTGGSSVAKIECSEYKRTDTPEPSDRAFYLAQNRTVIENNSFIADYDMSYILRILSTDGGVAYLWVDLDSLRYSIGVQVFSSSGEELSKPQSGEDFTVKVRVGNDKRDYVNDIVVLAIYSEDGRLLHTDSQTAIVSALFEYDEIYFNVPAQSENIGSIKAFVWDGYDTMQPLSDAREISYQ